MATIPITRLHTQVVQEGGTWEAIEKASQTFLAGALLSWDASGGVVEAVNPNAATTINLAGIADTAGQNGGSLGAKRTRFYPLRKDILVEANLAAAAGDVVLTNAHIGAVVGFEKRTAGVLHWIAIVSPTQAHGRIVGVAPGSAIGDTNARVLVSVFADDIASIKRIAT